MMDHQEPPDPLARHRQAWKRAILFGFSFLMEKDSAGILVLSGGRVTVVVLTAVWSVAVLHSPELLATWPAAWLASVLAFALRVHIDLEVLRPGAALGMMQKLMQRSGQGTGVALAGRESPALQPFDGWGGTEPEGGPAVETDDRFYGDRPPEPERPTLATDEPIPQPDAPATVADALAGAPPPSLAKSSDMQQLDALLQANGIRHFSALELAKPGRRHESGVVNAPPPRDLWRNIIPTARVLEWLREQVGRPVTVTSGYRSLAYNRAVGSKDGSLHPAFNAADIQVPGMTPQQVHAILERHPDARRFGLGLYQSFIHVDTRGVIGRPAPARW
jgi:hypothetical protein